MLSSLGPDKNLVQIMYAPISVNIIIWRRQLGHSGDFQVSQVFSLGAMKTMWLSVDESENL